MITDCRRMAPELTPFIEGELDPELAREVSAHLKLCAGCWRKTARISRTVRLLLAGSDSEPPPGLLERTLVRSAAELG